MKSSTCKLYYRTVQHVHSNLLTLSMDMNTLPFKRLLQQWVFLHINMKHTKQWMRPFRHWTHHINSIFSISTCSWMTISLTLCNCGTSFVIIWHWTSHYVQTIMLMLDIPVLNMNWQNISTNMEENSVTLAFLMSQLPQLPVRLSMKNRNGTIAQMSLIILLMTYIRTWHINSMSSMREYLMLWNMIHHCNSSLMVWQAEEKPLWWMHFVVSCNHKVE